MIKYPVLIILTYLMFGCSVFDEPETVPGYIYLQDFTLTTQSNEGTNNHKIVDCWVYVNDRLFGIYSVPAEIPIIANGDNKITIKPGIIKNGISGERVAYPFYSEYEEIMTIVPNETDTLSIDLTYDDDLYIWVEDFEDPSYKLNKTANSDGDFTVVGSSDRSDLLEGDAGLISLDASQTFLEMRTDEVDFNFIPRNLQVPAYLEMNYKCNAEFQVGLLSKDDGISIYVPTTLITLNAQAENIEDANWNKIYLFLPDVTNFYQTATDFDLFIKVFNQEGKSDVQVLVDNLKVIYRN